MAEITPVAPVVDELETTTPLDSMPTVEAPAKKKSMKVTMSESIKSVKTGFASAGSKINGAATQTGNSIKMKASSASNSLKNISFIKGQKRISFPKTHEGRAMVITNLVFALLYVIRGIQIWTKGGGIVGFGRGCFMLVFAFALAAIVISPPELIKKDFAFMGKFYGRSGFFFAMGLTSTSNAAEDIFLLCVSWILAFSYMIFSLFTMSPELYKYAKRAAATVAFESPESHFAIEEITKEEAEEIAKNLGADADVEAVSAPLESGDVDPETGRLAVAV